MSILAVTKEKFLNSLNDDEVKPSNNTPPETTKSESEVLSEKKFLGLNLTQWGYVSVVTNGLSVVFQLQQLFKTNKAKSFDMKFIFLMTILNATYFILGIITNNIGLAIATFFFVYYNLTVMYIYYFGKNK
tara:strand:+ start:182 stop:574 length:393 start_codon:yes stop_codon:yes gene_type:complete